MLIEFSLINIIKEERAMKKVILTLGLAILVLLSQKLEASELTIRMFDNSMFDLVLNDDVFRGAEGSITISNITSGRNYIKVLKYRRGSHQHYPSIAFEGMVTIRRNMAVFAMIDRFGRFIVEREIALHAAPYHPPVYAPPYMSDVDFSHLKMSIDRLSFDSSKLQLAKQAVSSNTMTAMQVRELMFLFSFESNKLELAKFAYAHTYDKHRYYVVNDAFTFSSSIRSLDRYISGF